MKLSSRLFLKLVIVFAALILLGTSMYVFAGGQPHLGFGAPAPDCPPPWWMWAVLAGLLLPWIPFLLFRRNVIVTFDDGVDDRPYQQKYKKGQKVVVPDAFHRPGYYIEGWYRSKQYEKKKKWNFKDKIERSMTLHAKWEPDGTPIESD